MSAPVPCRAHSPDTNSRRTTSSACSNLISDTDNWLGGKLAGGLTIGESFPEAGIGGLFLFTTFRSRKPFALPRARALRQPRRAPSALPADLRSGAEHARKILLGYPLGRY